MQDADSPRDVVRGPGGELRVQQVGAGVRVLCGVVAAAMLAFGGYLMVIGHAPGRWLAIPFFALIAAPFGAIAWRGWRSPVIDPVASERFRELADPARALTAEDFGPAAAPSAPEAASSAESRLAR